MMQRRSCNEQLLTSELEKIQGSVTTKPKPRNSRPYAPTIQDISEPEAGDGGNHFSNISLEETSTLALEAIGPPSPLELSSLHSMEENSITSKSESGVGL